MQNDMFSMLMTMMAGSNPQQMLQQAIMNNPQNNQLITQLQNSIKSSGMSSKDYAIQFFKQRGISEQQLMQMAKKFGIQ